MSRPHITQLDDRGVVTVSGPDAAKLLQGVVTNDIEQITQERALFAGLLSPQGKVLFDFIITRRFTAIEAQPDRAEDTYYLDVALDQAPALVKRLSIYKLRAKVEIKDESDTLHVLAMWGDRPCFICLVGMPDPRCAELGQRAIGSRQFVIDDMSCSNGDISTFEAYNVHRISLGVPEGGKDYAFGEAFAHEALFDQLHGVSFTKGCYVGQEIVSRMEHRGTARKRIVPVNGSGALPPPGTEVKAGDVTIGVLGSVTGTRSLALVRLDRAAEFIAKGTPIEAGDVALSIDIPSWATFALPVGEAQAGPT